MLQAIYCSVATHEFRDEELVGLLEKSRMNNARLDITGMLVYDDRTFLQVIEGPNDCVERLLETLRADPRHRKVRILAVKEIAIREFGCWEMAFFRNDSQKGDPDGFLDLSSIREEFTIDSSMATQMLTLFQEGLFKDTAEEHPDSVGSCTVTIRSKDSSNDPKRKRYLTELGRVMAISLPEVPIVVTGKGADVTFNQKRDLDCGEIELF